MNSPRGNSILNLPLAEAGFSDAFAAVAKKQGLSTMREILDIRLTELLKKDWITHNMWEELLKKMDEIPRVHGI